MVGDFGKVVVGTVLVYFEYFMARKRKMTDAEKSKLERHLPGGPC